MNRTLRPFVILLLVILMGGQCSYAAGIVRFVVAIDTEPIAFNPGKYNQELNLNGFVDRSLTPSIFDVMNSEWRDKYADDFGNSLKITWFVMTHEAFRHAVNGNPASVYDVLLKHKSSIDTYGDEIAWHYHHADWTDFTGDGDSCWNQVLTFDNTEYTHGLDVELAERNLNYLLMKRGFFPSSFRSGWVWENDDFSKWLEGIIPFDFSAMPPYKNKPGRDRCRRNVNDWSRAPAKHSGYHPKPSDYQNTGVMKRTIFRTDEFQDRSGDHRLKRLIDLAREGEDQIICITTHSYNNIQKFIDSLLPGLLEQCHSSGVPIQYQTASEAAASLQVKCELAKPEIKIEQYDDSLVMSISEDIFQRVPYCVVEYSSGLLARVYAQRRKTRQWVVILHNGGEVRFACAVSNSKGQTAVMRLDLEGEG